MTDIYFKLICKIYIDNQIYAKLCILGDKNQSIYDFKDADERFLIYSDKLFNFISVRLPQYIM